MENNKIESQKSWLIEVIEYTDGSSKIRRTNDGFTPIELLGLCELSSRDIREQIAGTIQPTIVERNVIVD